MHYNQCVYRRDVVPENISLFGKHTWLTDVKRKDMADGPPVIWLQMASMSLTDKNKLKKS